MIGAVRIIETDSSIWTLDFENMEFKRVPKSQKSRETTYVPYEQTEWTPFFGYRQTTVHETEGPLNGRVRFFVYVHEFDTNDFITSTYLPELQIDPAWISDDNFA